MQSPRPGEWDNPLPAALLAGMAAGVRLVPDWRDAAAYAPLLGADRSLFAWEWLRRDPGYRADAEARAGAATGVEEGALRWGLHAFEVANRTVPDARPVWTAEADPFVLAAEAGPPTGREDFDLSGMAGWSTLVTAVDGRQHLLISDGFRAIRIDVLTGSLALGPVQIGYRLAGLRSAERPVLTLRRFLALWRSGEFPRSLHPGETRARRWILMLRACDALAVGATQREIAGALLSADALQPLWRSQAPSLRSRAQRLVRAAAIMQAAGYRRLLAPLDPATIGHDGSRPSSSAAAG